VAGATGYVGRHLIKALISAKYPVRCLVRRPETLQSYAANMVEVIKGDVLEPKSLGPILQDVHTAFYLVHSMSSEGNFAENDRRAALNFVTAAKEAGVQRIIYLGGLGREEDLSAHLASRQEVGRIFRNSGITSIEFRASIIIGSGSLSFEMIRTLVEKLPLMITPRWVLNMAQPIVTEDVIAYLREAIEIPIYESRVFEIGGPDRISYQGIMKEYAWQRGLKRLMIPVPVLTPYLSSLWLGLVSPLYVRIGRTLIESIKNPTIVNDKSALQFFSVRPCRVREAIKNTIEKEDRNIMNFRAADKFPDCPQSLQHRTFQQYARVFDVCFISLPCSSDIAFKPIRRIGGKVGWYYANLLWQLRGLIDKLFGGVGMRRARRDAEHLREGDVLDFWRVEVYEPNHLLRLRAEMKLPGRAWLQFEVQPDTQGTSIYQTAIFDPLGLAGLLYWYGLYPIHQFIFKRMLKNVAKNSMDE